MFKGEVFQLISQVLKSWQVIFVTIVLILFLKLVFNAAKAYRSPRPKKLTVKKKKEAPVAAPVESSEVSDNDELGLEES
jgi:hypothetical protein